MTICAEVIAIGDEITSGSRLDTNSQWLASQFGELGVRTLYHSSVGDDFDACVDVFRIAIGRSDYIIMTGGLGPTQDDLTRKAIAAATDRPIEIRQEALDHIQSFFVGREMPDRNRLQAEFPQGSRLIHNPHGTAPGIDLTVERPGRPDCHVFCLPGVPAEMRQMWNAGVAVRMRELLGVQRVVRQHVVKCFGVGESDMESRIADLLDRKQTPQVGITVNRATISLRIFAEGSDEADCQSQIDRVTESLRQRVGEFIFGEGDDFELQDAIIELLDRRGETLCCVEHGFNSLADTWLSACERPDLYRGGLSLSDQRASNRWRSVLGVPQNGSPEQWTAEVMERFDADWALAIDGYPTIVPGEGKTNPSSDIRLVVTGRKLATPRSITFHMGGHPDVLPPRIGKAGLNFLRQVLLAN
ncbi:competence/damage-inducible protein A [Rosistilla oblonga]|uniref:Competence-damage inducible protein n=1 Tax=Rosistilla oblonga TaxID=2527990 RepID=A0A518IS34_9BACT|nr:molybdopterin-binding protein [Rosistilla oblonga]QDV55906.1 Putative competence-damage inducible protein [Rosistilla oblonga]